MSPARPTVLIVEDGNEYLETLTRFVPGPVYLQAHSGREAIGLLSRGGVDIVYLDMRFDRTDPSLLEGDRVRLTAEMGDAGRALRHLQVNQGLFVLDALRKAGHGGLPVVIAYDFSGETRRFEHLRRQYPALRWVPDSVTPEQIRALIEEIAAAGA